MDIIKWHMPKRINNPDEPIKPEGIILHYVGNPGTSAWANAHFFHTVNAMQSANYVVDDDHIYEVIPPNRKSYGTNSAYYNGRYVQIEMCHRDTTGYISEATLKNVVWLCKKLIAEYGCDKIIRHYDVSGKRCPLWYVEHPMEWDKLKERILNKEVVVVAETPKPDNTPSPWAKDAVEWAVENGVIRGDENGNLGLHELCTVEKQLTILYRALSLDV